MTVELHTGDFDNQCFNNFQRHDLLINQNVTDIKDMQLSMKGIPEQLQYMNKQIEEMCRLMRDGEARYLRKEEFNLDKKSICDDIAQNKIDIAKFVKDAKDDIDKITKKIEGFYVWTLATLSAALLGLIIFLIQGHMKV